jgi:hypothetical protein
MPPSISRRRLIAGGGALAGAAAGGAWFAPVSYLPDTVAVARTRVRSVPQLNPRPPVTDDHVQQAASGLSETIDRAVETWERVESQDGATTDLPNFADPERSIDSARGYLENVRNSDGWEALFDGWQGADFAGRAIGGSLLALEETSGEQLAENAREIQSTITETRERVAYEVADPLVGLARLYWVEKWLAIAGLDSYRGGVYAGQDEPTTEYDDHTIVETWGSHVSARRRRADAALLYEDYRAAQEPTTDVSETVEAAVETFEGTAQRLSLSAAERDRWREQTESMEEGPALTFRAAVHRYARNIDVRLDQGPWAGLTLYRAVKNARAILEGRAGRAVRDRSPVDSDTDRIDATRLGRAKERGLALLRQRRQDADGHPLVALLAEEGRRLLWAGDEELRSDPDDDRPHKRARAFARYLLAVEYLQRVPDAVSRFEPSSG